jgi:hypothetical protein
MSEHAKLSPSSAHRWMACPASLLLESTRPDTSSVFADEGTAAHFLAAKCIENREQPGAFIGYRIAVGEKGKCTLEPGSFDGGFLIDTDMAKPIEAYVIKILEYAQGHDLMVEQRVNFSTYVGVPDQFGTADAIILTSDGEELQVHDLKFGRGVRVDAERNEQMMLYALGAYEQFEALGDIKRVRMVIHQPRLEYLSECDMSVADLLDFAAQAKTAAQKAVDIMDTGIYDPNELVPGDKQCRFCKAKATCPKLAAHVENIVGATFDDLTRPAIVKTVMEVIPHYDDDFLAPAMAATDLIEGWCKAVRAETERRLLAGTPVPGWKLVQGKQGNRAWVDEAQAETTLKSMRIKHEEMYDYKIVSPTTAEKLFKAKVIGPRQWPALQQLITRSAGNPSVAPESDKREALVLRSADDFTTVDEGADLV